MKVEAVFGHRTTSGGTVFIDFLVQKYMYTMGSYSPYKCRYSNSLKNQGNKAENIKAGFNRVIKLFDYGRKQDKSNMFQVKDIDCLREFEFTYSIDAFKKNRIVIDDDFKECVRLTEEYLKKHFINFRKEALSSHVFSKKFEELTEDEILYIEIETGINISGDL